MLKVGFHARMFQSESFRGIGRYALNLLKRLPDHGVTPVLCSNAPLFPAHVNSLAGCEVAIGGPQSPMLWEMAWGGLAEKAGAKLLHGLGNYGLPLTTHLPTVLTVHDAIDYTFYSDHNPGWRQFRRRALVGRWLQWTSRLAARKVVTVSRHAAAEIHRRLRVPARNIEVIYEAADEAFRRPSEAAIADVTSKLGLSSGYFFYYGGWESRKNVPFLLEAFARSGIHDAKLALAGGNNSDAELLKAQAHRLGIQEKLVWLGRVTDEELAALLSGSLAFVYPSKAEGFGLQLCEAMACGCPILAARASCLPEILGRGGETFSLANPNELSALFAKTAVDSVWRESLKLRAKERGRDFDWNTAARQTAELYRQLLLTDRS